MGGDATTRARSVEVPAFVSTGGGVVSARCVEGAASVSMGGAAVSARSVEGAPVQLVTMCPDINSVHNDQMP